MMTAIKTMSDSHVFFELTLAVAMKVLSLAIFVKSTSLAGRRSGEFSLSTP
jgi:hypothetical protein